MNSSHSVTLRETAAAAVTCGSGGAASWVCTLVHDGEPDGAGDQRRGGAARARRGLDGKREACVNMPAECPAVKPPHNPADSRGEGPPKAARRHRPSGADRHRPKGRPAGRPPGRVAGGGRSLIIEDMAPSAESPQPAALREELTPELEIAQLTAALEALRDDRQRASAWRRSSATPCSWRSTCWSRIPTCADSSAPSSSGWWTTPRRTPAACGCSTRPAAPPTCGWRTSAAKR